jgi:hypothetical protein
LRGVESLLRDPPGLANAIDRLAKFLEHPRVDKPGLEKRRDTIQVCGRAHYFGFDLLSKGTIRICEILHVDGHQMTYLSGCNCAVYQLMMSQAGE